MARPPRRGSAVGVGLPHIPVGTLDVEDHRQLAVVVDLRPGATRKRAAKLFGSEYDRIKQDMKRKNCQYDDTGQRVNGENRWLWIFISKEAALYYTNNSRSKNVVYEILGEDYNRVTVQDFYPSYDGAPGLKQKCWSHLIRAARDLTEKKNPVDGATEFCDGLKQIYHDAKEIGDMFNVSPVTPEERSTEYAEFVQRLSTFACMDWKQHDLKRLAKRALKYRHELFTFIHVPNIEPTNNRSERALRPCVRQRKIWGCHRTAEGAINRDIIMSVLETMKLQNKEFLHYGREYVLNHLI